MTHFNKVPTVSRKHGGSFCLKKKYDNKNRCNFKSYWSTKQEIRRHFVYTSLNFDVITENDFVSRNRRPLAGGFTIYQRSRCDINDQ